MEKHPRARNRKEPLSALDLQNPGEGELSEPGERGYGKGHLAGAESSVIQRCGYHHFMTLQGGISFFPPSSLQLAPPIG